MKITLNNIPHEFIQGQLTISELLDLKKYTFKMLIVKINGKLIRKEDYSSCQVRENDDVSVLHLMSGG